MHPAGPLAARRVHPGVILALVCAAQFMVVLDVAVVNVALPSLQADLGLDQSDLQWVVITYGLTLGGLLLLGGRAADLLGRRQVLVAGLSIFTVSSLVAGFSTNLGMLVSARAAQGVGAALMAPAALSILVSTFPEGPARTKALGLFGAVGGSAASVGVTVSGALTSGPGWEWIFFVNVPIGVMLATLVLRFVPRQATTGERARGRFDAAGAVSVTLGLMAIVYAINKSVTHGWTSATTLGFLAGGVALLAVFAMVESRAAAPLLPLSLLRRPTLVAANLVAVLSFGAFLATIFQASLFMQQVLHYSAIRTGVAYLGIALTAFIVAGGLAARLVDRFGASAALVLGNAASATGLLLLARAPADAAYWSDLFPAFVAIGIGIGFFAMAVQVAVFIGIEGSVSGVVGGLVETSREVGGALATAVVATVALARSDAVLAGAGGGADARPHALTSGFHRGSVVAAGFNIVALLVAGLYLRRVERRTAAVPAPVPAATGDPVPGMPAPVDA